MRFLRVVLAVVAAFLATMIVGAIAALRARGRSRPVVDEAAPEVAIAGILGPLYFRSTASAFRGGKVDCWYGGGAVDLREATLDPAGAHLRVRALFGGGQIVVPATWQVRRHVIGLGGIRDSRPSVERPAGAPELTIEGLAVFGGFEVVSDVPETTLDELREAAARFGTQEEPTPA